MNKLVLGNKDELDNIFITEDTYLCLNLDNVSPFIRIEVSAGVCLKVFCLSKNLSNNIKIVLNKDSSVIFNNFSINNSGKVDFDLEENTSLEFNLNIINYGGNYIEQNINHLGDNIISKVVNHCVNYSLDEFMFYVNSNISKSSNNSNSFQDNKIINMNGGKNKILPNLIVDNNLVDASHAAYIGSFNSDVYFYLKSRGLKKEVIDKLLIEGFLIGYVDLSEEEKEMVLNFFDMSN